MQRLKIFVVGRLLAAALTCSAAAPAAAAADRTICGCSCRDRRRVFLRHYGSQPIWFRGGANTAAIAKLTAILQRAPFDGFPEGPQLAAQVQAAAAQAASGKPEDVANAERVLSSAWVQYVQAIKKPTTGMIYAYPVLQPQGARRGPDPADRSCSTFARDLSRQHLGRELDLQAAARHRLGRGSGVRQSNSGSASAREPRSRPLASRKRPLPARRFRIIDAHPLPGRASRSIQ